MYAAEHDADAALARGRRLRAEIDDAADPVGVLVVADGAHTLTPPAPGGYDPDSIPRAGRAGRRAGRGRRRRADPAARRRRGPGRPSRCWPVWPGPARAVRQGALPRRALRCRVLRRRLAAVRPIAIVGPTGTGKSALALDVAERLGGEIVNADAMQLYRGMDIGTAKLPVAERRGIPHHQLDVLDVTETATVARYQQRRRPPTSRRSRRAARCRSSSAARCSTSSRCSTTGRSRRPTRRCGPSGRSGWPRSASRRCTPSWPAVDPAAAASILPTDGRRIVRALEVVGAHRTTVRRVGAGDRSRRAGTPLIVGLDWDTALLDERLAQRTDTMFADGLVDEVRALLDAGLRDGVTASRALGYAQVIADLDAGRRWVGGARADVLRDPPLRPPPTVVVPP